MATSSNINAAKYELGRKKQTTQFSYPSEGKVGDILKISFICGCKGNVIGDILDTGLDIPDGTCKETVSEEMCKVTYGKTEPIFEFKYSNIDVRNMNVTLSTSKTCLGATVYGTETDTLIKQRFVNDVMENLSPMCPTNTLVETIGKYGETICIPRREYAGDEELGTTRLITHERERVEWLINKNYGIDTCQVTIKTQTPEGRSKLSPTNCDAHKIVMIVTKKTPEGCESKKYIILASYLEVSKELFDMAADFPETVDFISNSIKYIASVGEKILVLSLSSLLTIGKKIIEECNGRGSVGTVPIDIYDLTGNNFVDFPEHEGPLNGRELTILRIIDNYGRKHSSY